jgi:hypothetical protein
MKMFDFKIDNKQIKWIKEAIQYQSDLLYKILKEQEKKESGGIRSNGITGTVENQYRNMLGHITINAGKGGPMEYFKIMNHGNTYTEAEVYNDSYDMSPFKVMLGPGETSIMVQENPSKHSHMAFGKSRFHCNATPVDFTEPYKMSFYVGWRAGR